MGRAPLLCKRCRREKQKLFLKGTRCLTSKCAVERRNYPPGGPGVANARLTEYGRRLREKQKARSIYGLTEGQFRSYFEKASEMAGVTGDKLLELLERRLDNVVFRLGFAASRQAARQLVRHGHVAVNGKKVNIPSYQSKVGNLIAIKPKALEKAAERLKEYTSPSWLSLNEEFVGNVVNLPTSEDVEKIIEVALIVEHYSR